MDGKKLSAALLVCLCFGSIHAYGVLLSPIEQWLGMSRMQASLGYAIAIAALTAGVYLNGRLEAMTTVRLRLIGCGGAASAGLVLATVAGTPAGLLLGFGTLYGLANGIAYASSLGLAARAMPGREGQAMGLATAAYGLGAAACAQFFSATMTFLSVPSILLLLAGAVMLASAAAALLSGPGEAVVASGERPQAPSGRGVGLLWGSYLLGAFAGLMVLAHAPGIAIWAGNDGSHGGLVSGVVSLGSVAGGYLGGLFAERLPGRPSLMLPLLLQAIAVVSLAFLAGLPSLLAAFALAGLCYGALIAAIPAEVRRMSGPERFAGDYGKVFTAWGLAGVAGPVAAGYLYDVTSGYGAALAGAGVLSVLASLFVMSIPRAA